ncbi:hypothetical protein RvY_04092-2 [Ramazzottius varieornatus]|uniref:Thyrotropin-releasing hormone receptor n=1 Tax=Ramazzottius varieornatus TaxID=947166 RepID=A0A1D1UQF2_RAMVA|nr:hypothetical protein RvY_04092-2 [Ramazzottius varieornatus]
MCSAFVFLNFFSINVGTVSMMLFTLERYIAACKPFLAQKLCTVERARRIIISCWILVAVYCSPWFVLAEVFSIEDSGHPHLTYCELTLSPAIYTAIFSADLVLFYILPLVGAVVAYWKIGRVIRRIPVGSLGTKYGLFTENSARVNRSTRRKDSIHQPQWSRNTSRNVRRGNSASLMHRSLRSSADPPVSRNTSFLVGGEAPVKTLHRSVSEGAYDIRANERLLFLHPSNVGTSLRVLLAIVFLFAVCWLPFRGLLLYNSLVKDPWLDLWYVLFAKCMIFLNCCVNPFLYTLLSKRFRKCVQRAMTLDRLKSLRLHKPTASWL